MSAALKSAIDTLQNTMSSTLQLVNHTTRLGPGDARAKLVIGKLFWMCLALVRVSDVSLDSSRLMKVALQALAVITNKKDLLKHAVETARPDDATCAWIEGVQQTMYDGVWRGVVPVLTRAALESGASCESLIGRKVRDVMLDCVPTTRHGEISIISLVVMISSHLRNAWLRSRDSPRSTKLHSVSIKEYLDTLRAAGAHADLLSCCARNPEDGYLQDVGSQLGKMAQKSLELVEYVSTLIVQLLTNRGVAGIASQLRIQCFGLALAEGFVRSIDSVHLNKFHTVLDSATIFALKPVNVSSVTHAVREILRARRVLAKAFSQTFMKLCVAKHVPFQSKLFQDVCEPQPSIGDLMQSSIRKKSFHWERCARGYMLLSNRDEAQSEIQRVQKQSQALRKQWKDDEAAEMKVIAELEEKDRKERERREEMVAAAKKADEEMLRKIKEEEEAQRKKEEEEARLAAEQSKTPPVPEKIQLRSRSSSIDLKKDGSKESLVVMDCDFDASPDDPEQISAVKGEYLFLITAYDDGWSQVRKRSNNKVGIVPSDFYNLAENQA